MQITVGQKVFIISIHSSYIVVLSLLISSCSSFINLYEDNSTSKTIKIPSNKLTCDSLNNKLNVIHESNYTINEFEIISQKLKNKYLFNFVELSLAYIVYLSIVRPDATNPYARSQYLIDFNKQKKYYDLNYLSHESFKHSLYKISKDYKTRNIDTLIRHIKLSLPLRFTVQKKLHQYLKINKNQLLKNDRFKHLFKLKSPLRVGETFGIHKIVKQVKSTSKKTISPPQFKLNLSNNGKYELNCNFDPGLYQNNIYILRKEKDIFNTFALNDTQGNFFIGHTTTKNHLQNSLVHQSRYPAPICQYSDKNKSITLLAFNSKDPAQIMYHLIDYDIFMASNPSELIEYLNFPRHEILNNPNRIIFESKRSSQKQLNHFLALNFPVYHSPSLGEIWSFFKFKQKPYYQYISDNRHPVAQSCLKKL